MQAFQTQIQQEGRLGRLGRAEVTHQLCGCLCDKCAALTEFFRIGNAVVAVIGSAETGEFIGMCQPIEIAAVYDTAADSRAVTVHVFCGGMGNDIRTPFDGTAVDGGCKGVVNNQRNAMCVCSICETLDIQNTQGGVCDGFAKDCLCIGFECRCKFFLCAVGRNEGEIDAHFLHGYREKVKCAAVDGGGCNDMIPAICNIEYGVEICRLSGGGQHCCCAAFQRSNFCRNQIAGGVLQSGIEIAGCLQIKKLPHVLTCVIFECGALVNGNLSGLPIAGGIATLYTFCFDTIFTHASFLLSKNIK